MKKSVIAMLIAIPVLILAGLYAYVLLSGPRMKVQPHVRAFQVVSRIPPPGTKSVDRAEELPSAASTPHITNPLPATEANISRGKVYYTYYCIFCHGEGGAGNGPVGESYIPVPSDLRMQRIGQYADGELLRAMLTGIGHEPVLERVVSPGHRWYLVHYVRTLSGRATGG